MELKLAGIHPIDRRPSSGFRNQWKEIPASGIRQEKQLNINFQNLNSS